MSAQVSLNDMDVRLVRPSDIRAEINYAMNRKRPVFIWGPPGIGKSEIVDSITQERSGYMIDMRLALMEPTDLRGIPVPNTNTGLMEWLPPADLPTQELADQFECIVLFLDEMNQAPQSVQAAAYQLILNRRLGNYRLPDNVLIVAAGNRESDRGVAYRMPSPLANRFVHLEMTTDFEDWQNWALTNDISAEVVGYVTANKMDLMNFDPRTASRAFATPRSWTFVSQMLPQEGEQISDSRLHDLIAGTVGDGIATKFMAHRAISGKLPNPTDILSGKVKTLSAEGREISAMFSLTASLCYELRDFVDRNGKEKMDELYKMADNFFRFMMDNFETEMTVLGGRTALKVYKLPLEPRKVPCIEEFFKKYGKLIIEAHNA
jgi:hypothetical protein